MRTRYHRDGTVTVWDCIRQTWTRTAAPPADLIATLSDDERERIAAHLAAGPRETRGRPAVLARPVRLGTIRLDAEMREALREKAAELGISETEAVREAIGGWVKP